jgi:hypothetical protein
MAGIFTLDQLRDLFAREGVRTAYVKLLSPKQDNEKNQIYLGTGLDGVTNIFPATIHARSASASRGKRKSREGQPKLEAQLLFAWLSKDGQRENAPTARIIDYFQYPEVRFSGFLKGTRNAPRALRRNEQARFGRRILVLGTAADGKVLGHVLTEADDPIAASFPDLPLAGSGGVLRVLTIDGAAAVPPAEQLRQEIAAIVRGGWYSSRINRGGTIVPFSGSQGGGYTLEALLGVAANGNKAPDRHGFEIKSFSGSRISLMTPTPDGGYQGKHTFREFMDRWGSPGQKNDGSRRFTGIHRCGEINERTGLGLRVSGYDHDADEFGDAEQVAVELFQVATGELVAAWSLEKLANCWNAKHANALYIPFESRGRNDGLPEYRYSDRWLTGTGTDIWKLLRAIDRGLVFYDPADTIYADGTPKVRSQWRINARDLPKAMRELYATSDLVTH